jgi:hypothetical protein
MARTDAASVHEERRRAAKAILGRKAAMNGGKLPHGIVAELQQQVKGLSKDAAMSAKREWLAEQRGPTRTPTEDGKTKKLRIRPKKDPPAPERKVEPPAGEPEREVPPKPVQQKARDREVVLDWRWW